MLGVGSHSSKHCHTLEDLLAAEHMQTLAGASWRGCSLLPPLRLWGVHCHPTRLSVMRLAPACGNLSGALGSTVTSRGEPYQQGEVPLGVI
jgi:hypothetical protein